MTHEKTILGIDIGSVSISLAALTGTGEIAWSDYRFHNGKVRETLTEMLRSRNISAISRITATSTTSDTIANCKRYDSRVSLIRGIHRFHPEIRSILYVGGERFGLIQFDENGSYRRSASNSSCAAGTGSFLDQQSKRLSMSGIEEFCAVASTSEGQPPKIASRCAVFAKTDLIHAQQEGHTLAQICDGLCEGLAKNIADTITSGEKISGPVFFAGGVSRNQVVSKHLSNLLGVSFTTDLLSPVYGAIGVALLSIDDTESASDCITTIESLFDDGTRTKSYYYDPLALKKTQYPSFESAEKFLFHPVKVRTKNPVEVDIYTPFPQNEFIECFLGIDIGSTSTKAILVENDGTVRAGFYTRTSGRPLDAVCALLESISAAAREKSTRIRIAGAGTTGSGRKFAGKIIGADLIVDEITAHARAAYSLNPDIDTIIEIGGQDAKFTTIRGGTVTFSVMNTVCAAGTGSFIEEQASRLGCALHEIAERSKGMRAPIASDRCTVFMERDINHLLANGYTVDECLASVLHSVRDNYLTKVAVEGAIGNAVCFQGATAKNSMLVAAFEQKLGKPIYVSEYCHLTGALGVALILKETHAGESLFRGLALYENDIPLEHEICELCSNHCKITVARIHNESVAYGFLCGREYTTHSFVDRNKSGFDLLRERIRVTAKKHPAEGSVTIGLPFALHMVDEIVLWRSFFERLGARVITSEGYMYALQEGKRLENAEFCAPMAAMHGHVAHIAEKCKTIFFPVYLEGRDSPKDTKRNYCYYTQFSSALGANLAESAYHAKLYSPVIHYGMSSLHQSTQLYRTIREIIPSASIFDVYTAYDKAQEDLAESRKKISSLYDTHYDPDKIQIAFIGRPYTVLSPSMNKGVPGIFASLGVKSFFQDMIPYTNDEVKNIEPLLQAFHWHYASKILEVAEVCATRKGLYPVFITSFKCAPDSFVMEYFKRIMERHGKPYLILQLDEHDSNVGYETRIESALRSFNNHHTGKVLPPSVKRLPVNPHITQSLRGKTILMPNWDNITCRMLCATLIRDGIDARLLEETPELIANAMRRNTGQCIPLSAIAHETAEYITKNNLIPERTAVWMLDSSISCNIRMYPYFIKSSLETLGEGLEKTDVYIGEITFTDLGPTVAINVYYAYFFGGILRKLACRIRPYEKIKGTTNRVLAQAAELVYSSILSNSNREETSHAIAELFRSIERTGDKKPKVAIFGDIYTRDNDIMNQNLIGAIEDAGGEVVITSYVEYLRLIASPYFKRWFMEGRYAAVVTGEALRVIINRIDRRMYKIFEDVLEIPYPEFDLDPAEIIRPFHVSSYNTGESLDNLIKVASLAYYNDDLALFVQASPAFCCPSLVTEAMARDIERTTEIPVVPITYDGTGGIKNDIIVPYIKYPRSRAKKRNENTALPV